MKLVHNPDLIQKLSDSHLLLDTNVFIYALGNRDFFQLLIDLRSSGSQLMTIPSVIYEFTKGARTAEEYNDYVDFINGLGVAVYKFAEDRLATDRAFAVILKSKSPKAGYAEFLLMMLLHQFLHMEEKIFLMSSNYKDIPLSLFSRDEIIGLEFNEGVQTQGLYKNIPENQATAEI